MSICSVGFTFGICLDRTGHPALSDLQLVTSNPASFQTYLIPDHSRLHLFEMPAGPVVIDLTHRDAPIEISDGSDSDDDPELPVAIEPPQPVSSVVRQRNVDERRARLLQRGIDEEAEERARQRQIARDEQIARRLQAMGGEGDIDVIQISSGEDNDDDSDSRYGRSSSPEDIHAPARRLARQEREWQEFRGSPPRRRYPRKFLLQSRSDCRVSSGDLPSDSNFFRFLHLQDMILESGVHTCTHLVVCARP